MEGKYFFNGKDISMNLYIQIRDVVDIIMEKSHFCLSGCHGQILSLKNLQSPAKYRKYFKRNLLAILQTAITKNKKKHK